MAAPVRSYDPPLLAPIAGKAGRRHRPFGQGGLLTTAVLVAAGILASPVLVVLASVFYESGGAWRHLAATVLPSYAANTAQLFVLVGIGVFLVGTGAAWLVVACRFPGRRLFEWALILPLAFPAYVLAYAYSDLLQHPGPVQTLLREVTGWGPRDYWFPNVRSLGAAAAMFTLVLYPYVYMLARASFLQQSIGPFEAARTLGLGPLNAFGRVALPLARPALATGVALALMETLADFGTVAQFGVPTFTTGVYRAWFSMGDRLAAAQLASVMVGIVFTLILIERWSRGRARFAASAPREDARAVFRLTGWRGWLATTACAVPVLGGFLIPAIVLLHLSITSGHALFGARYIELALNSLTVAGVGALLAVVLALLFGYAGRYAPNVAVLGANRLVGLGYAVPGAVIAVGILIPLAAFDNWLDAWMRSTVGISTGLLLTGSLVALVLAYLVRFLAISLTTVEAGLAKVTPAMDDAARSLGHTRLGTLRRVHLPLLRGGLLTAGLLVFVDIMKELPATLILRPFDFDTLAIQAYRLASDERLAEASTPALAIVAIGLLPVILLSRQIGRGRPLDQRGAAAPVLSPVPDHS